MCFRRSLDFKSHAWGEAIRELTWLTCTYFRYHWQNVHCIDTSLLPSQLFPYYFLARGFSAGELSSDEEPRLAGMLRERQREMANHSTTHVTGTQLSLPSTRDPLSTNTLFCQHTLLQLHPPVRHNRSTLPRCDRCISTGTITDRFRLPGRKKKPPRYSSYGPWLGMSRAISPFGLQKLILVMIRVKRMNWPLWLSRCFHS